MKKKIIWIVIFLISHAIFFIVGDIRGKHLAMNYVFKEAKKADIEVALGRYTIYRDIVADIKSGKNDFAICRADLEASAYFDDIKSCLANQDCRGSIEKKTREVAPEALSELPLKFNYLKSENGIRRCDDKEIKIDVKPAR